MAIRQIFKQLSQQFEADQEAVQRILVQLIGARFNVTEDCLLHVDVTLQQCLGEFVLVGEMVEETTLGDADFHDDFLDGRCRKSLFDDTETSHIQYLFPLAGAYSLHCRKSLF